MTNEEAVRYLDAMADQANMLARLYEDMAAGFDSEAEYQEHAADAFAADMESIDLAEVRP